MLGRPGVRILSLETSAARGSVALLESVGGELVAGAEHREPNAHAEQLLKLVEQVLGVAAWPKTSLERIAVGIGPGSFTGLRVGIALAEGIGLGLGVPVVGVASLRAMARAVPISDARVRVAILDARRDEVFAAAYAADGRELLSPCALPLGEARAKLEALSAERVFVGSFAEALGPDLPVFRHESSDLPHARWVGVVGGELEPEAHPPDPIYVRGAGATLPNLPPSPISPSPRGTG